VYDTYTKSGRVLYITTSISIRTKKWTAEDNKLYKPITKDIVDGVTHELTLQDVENDPN
jgi:hypothetical protein